MEDSIPSTRPGQIVALADKLDTLRGAFGIGMIPTGSKDPFALRRAAQGIIKILVEGEVDLPFKLGGGNRELEDFLLDRVRYYFKEVRGFAYDEVNAVLGAGITTLKDALARLEALQNVRSTPDFEPLAASFKRIRNILDQAHSNPSMSEGGSVNAELLHEDAEKNLWSAVTGLQPEGPGYREQLVAIASLRPAVDFFFDKVMVNTPDAEIRANRLALLGHLRAQVSRIADISEIVTSNA
jgi:glycyl-tRNA synthetase beta chain